MKLKDMTDQDLYDALREQMFADDRYKIPANIAKEIKRRQRENPSSFDFLKPLSEPKRPNVRLTLTNRECNILLGELYSAIQEAQNWLRNHSDNPSNSMIERRMNEKIVLGKKISARLEQ